MIGVPLLSIQLTTPSGTTDITNFVTQEEACVITDAIETAHEIGTFTAADITIKGRDRMTATVRSILHAIPPNADALGWYLTINKDGQTRFYGDILANTVAIDDKEGSFSFTAVGLARRLARTDASGISGLTRSAAGWILSLAGTPLKPYNAILTVFKSGATTCDFMVGDRVQLVANGSPVEEFTLLEVEETTTSGQWNLYCDRGMDTAYPQGVTALTLLTPYLRNVSLSTLVQTLFTGSSLAAPTITIGPLIATGALFASPLGTTGLSGTLRGICPSIDLGTPANSGKRIWAGTTAAVYEQASPPSGSWSSVTTAPAAPLDPTNYGVNLDLYGRRTFKVRINQPGYGTSNRFDSYAYDYSATSSPFVRWKLEVTINANLPDPPYPYLIRLLKETSTDKKTWSPVSTVTVDTGNSTDTDLNPFGPSFSVEVDPTTGNVFFVDFTVAAGLTGAFQISSYQPGSATLTRNITLTSWPSGVSPRGTFRYLPSGHLCLFNLDSQLSNVPWEYTFTISSPAQLTLVSSAGMPGAAAGSSWGGLQPYSVKKNTGDGRYYALTASVIPSRQVIEVWLLSFADDTFNADAFHPATRVWTFYNVNVDGLGNVATPPRLDLIVWKDPSVSSGRFPLVVQLGDVAQLVSDTYSGNVAYADLEGLSAADALGQLAILANAYYYVNPFASTFFRSRDQSGGTIASALDDNLENTRQISCRYQPVWANAPRYVRVENEKDETIYGEAGDAQFRNSEAYSLIVKCRYVPTNSYATALAATIYAYAGAQKRYVDIEHMDDFGDRSYAIGRRFKATLDATQRTFQIVSLTTYPFGRTLQLQGLEV